MTPARAASAASSLATLLDGPATRHRVVAGTRTATYLRSESGAMIGMEHPGGAQLPLSLVTDGPHPTTDTPVRVGGGGIEWPGHRVEVRRWWDATTPVVRPDPGLVDRARRRVHPDGTPPRWDRHSLPVGAGPGATPEGDDWLAGRLVGLRVVGDTAEVDALRDRIRPLLPTTTPLSAALLEHAARGEVCRPARRLLSALDDEAALDPALDELLALGSTSGWWLAAGILDGLREPEVAARG